MTKINAHAFRVTEPFFLLCLITTGSHRSDRKIRQVFETLFPGQIESAEMLIDTMELESVLDKRRGFIEKFENFEAKYQYQHWRFYNGQQHSSCAKAPTEPKVSTDLPFGCLRV